MHESRFEQCKIEVKVAEQLREEIPGIVDQLVQSCNTEDCFDHVDLEPLPSKEKIIDIIHISGRILYPGYFTNDRIDKVNLNYSLGRRPPPFLRPCPGRLPLQSVMTAGGIIWRVLTVRNGDRRSQSVS